MTERCFIAFLLYFICEKFCARCISEYLRKINILVIFLKWHRFLPEVFLIFWRYNNIVGYDKGNKIKSKNIEHVLERARETRKKVEKSRNVTYFTLSGQFIALCKH